MGLIEVVLNHGHVVERGNPAELCAGDGPFAKLPRSRAQADGLPLGINR